MKKVINLILLIVWEPFNIFFLIILNYIKFHHMSFGVLLAFLNTRDYNEY